MKISIEFFSPFCCIDLMTAQRYLLQSGWFESARINLALLKDSLMKPYVVPAILLHSFVILCSLFLFMPDIDPNRQTKEKTQNLFNNTFFLKIYYLLCLCRIDGKERRLAQRETTGQWSGSSLENFKMWRPACWLWYPNLKIKKEPPPTHQSCIYVVVVLLPFC